MGWKATNYKMSKEIFTFLIIFLLFLQTYGFERKLTYMLNPGCPAQLCSENVTVVHIIATGPNDTLHHIWDFSGKPSILIATTSHTNNLSINWEEFLIGGGKDSIKFSSKPKYTFGIVLNKLIEYNDVNDTGYLNMIDKRDSYIQNIDTRYFHWKQSHLVLENNNVILNIVGSGEKFNRSTGSVKISLNGFGYRDHSSTLPHLLHSANSTVIEVEIDGLATHPNFNSSRFAVELLLASNDNAQDAMLIDDRKSLDDEQSPGVFTLVDLLTPSSKNTSEGGFLQWRPVAYVGRQRSLANSTETTSYNVSNVDDPSYIFNNTLLYAFYGYELINRTLVQSTVVSFGLKQDGFFKKTNYTSWAFTIGYGKPPNEDFSLLVIMVICIGLGLPALLILVSGVVFTVRRITRKKDELCLSR